MKMPAHIAKVPQNRRNCRECLYSKQISHLTRDVVFCRVQKCDVRAEGKVCFHRFTRITP